MNAARKKTENLMFAGIFFRHVPANFYLKKVKIIHLQHNLSFCNIV